MFYLGLLGALSGLGLGALGLLRPHAALRLVGLGLREGAPHGISEVRATYGGLFVGMEAAILLGGEPMLYLVGAAAWFGAAIARTASIIADRIVNGPNLMGTTTEFAIGALHLAPLLLLTA